MNARRFQIPKGMFSPTRPDRLFNAILDDISISDHMYRMAMFAMLSEDPKLDISKLTQRFLPIISEI